MAWVIHEHVDVDTLAASVATVLQDKCGEAIALRGQALLALGGGRTPLPLYRRLARCPLPWSQVTLLPTDERCVPHDHPACNLREIGAAFAVADGVQRQGLTPPNGDPEWSERYARAAIAHHPQPFDAVVLGMGMDGHTASLFPGVPELPAALDTASEIDACRIDPQPLPPEAPYPRVTLTVARLLRARSLHLYISGADKRAVLERALQSRDVLRYPIGAFLHADDARLHVHWSP